MIIHTVVALADIDVDPLENRSVKTNNGGNQKQQTALAIRFVVAESMEVKHH